MDTYTFIPSYVHLYIHTCILIYMLMSNNVFMYESLNEEYFLLELSKNVLPPTYFKATAKI